jgi:hypothetical protein
MRESKGGAGVEQAEWWAMRDLVRDAAWRFDEVPEIRAARDGFMHAMLATVSAHSPDAFGAAQAEVLLSDFEQSGYEVRPVTERMEHWHLVARICWAFDNVPEIRWATAATMWPMLAIIAEHAPCGEMRAEAEALFTAWLAERDAVSLPPVACPTVTSPPPVPFESPEDATWAPGLLNLDVSDDDDDDFLAMWQGAPY